MDKDDSKYQPIPQTLTLYGYECCKCGFIYYTRKCIHHDTTEEDFVLVKMKYKWIFTKEVK